MSAIAQAYKEFFRLSDSYYWKTALLIARHKLSKQYRNSFLGILWTLIQPITMVLVYSTIMPMIMKIGKSGYVLYIVTSLPLWTYISSSLVISANSLLGEGDTLKRCMISSTIFPVAEVLKNTYTYFIAFGSMYLVATLFFVEFRPTFLLVPLYILPVIVIIMSMAIAISFAAPYVRDIGEVIQMAMTVMVWLTPVFYPIDILPAAVQQIMVWNPFYIMIRPIHALAYDGILPTMIETVKLFGVMFLAIGAGYLIYRTCRRNYVYYL